jgi:hypothetical protein
MRQVIMRCFGATVGLNARVLWNVCALIVLRGSWSLIGFFSEMFCCC